MIEGGYFVIARTLFDSAVMDWPPVWFKLWIWLIGKANHADTRQGGTIYRRGEVLTSYKELMDIGSYKVGWRLVRPSKTMIRDFCEALREATMATTRKTTRGFFIKLEKYDLYQNPASYEDYNEKSMKTTRRPQTDPTINKNDKNDKNVLISPYPLLSSIGRAEMEQISQRYQVPVAFVRSRLDDMENWLEATGKKPDHYKNYYRALCNWVKKDALQIKQDYAKHTSDLAL
ncbi:MAG: hypothetical protein GX558_12870 [Clostridiales bacterium]|nr:hypothetical protein [Clostridiales bacterium]